MKGIAEVGHNSNYAFVAVRCPVLLDAQCLHDTFIDLAVNKANGTMTSGAQVVTYIVPKAEWEKTFCR